jgi:hypothetical protein
MVKMLSTTVGVAGGIVVSACNTCASPIEPPLRDDVLDLPLLDEAEVDEEPPPFSLPKHDWNGLAVMANEGQARKTLRTVGFTLKPGRSQTFMTFDPLRQIIHLRTKIEDTPSMVFLETERKERILKNVWGVRLVFLNNRLVQFSPQYFTSPVELVEPDEEFVPASDMEQRLRETFGAPNVLDGTADVIHHGAKAASKESACVWSDASLTVLFVKTSEAGILRYALVFSSPEGMLSVDKILGKSLPWKSMKSQPEAINF